MRVRKNDSTKLQLFVFPVQVFDRNHLTVTDNITIEKKGETAAVSDISEGDIVKLTYSDSGELTGVKLKGHKHSRSTDGTSDSTTKKKSKRKTSVSAEENTTKT